VCTLAVALGTDRRWPLVVAANRDERLGRPAEGWALRDGPGGLRYAAPRDLLAGGTWIGVSSGGLFAGVTNFHAPDHPADPARSSRGELVGTALASGSVAGARRALSSLGASRFNPFHLLVADGESALLWWFDGDGAGFETLGTGLHLVTENSPLGRCPRGEAVRAGWPVDHSLPALRRLLSEHSGPARAPTCIHAEPVYGTRSSAILRIAPSLSHSELYVAGGPPCVTPLEDHSQLLAALVRSP